MNQSWFALSSSTTELTLAPPLGTTYATYEIVLDASYTPITGYSEADIVTFMVTVVQC